MNENYLGKQAFIQVLSDELKVIGFRRNGQYWYMTGARWYYCVNVQGSQWCKDDYYVNIGVADRNTNYKNPSILHWKWVHRCTNEFGQETNIGVCDVVKSATSLFREFSVAEQESVFYEKYHATNINGRMFI